MIEPRSGKIWPFEMLRDEISMLSQIDVARESFAGSREVEPMSNLGRKTSATVMPIVGNNKKTMKIKPDFHGLPQSDGPSQNITTRAEKIFSDLVAISSSAFGGLIAYDGRSPSRCENAGMFDGPGVG
jgi:hypothetical protein